MNSLGHQTGLNDHQVYTLPQLRAMAAALGIPPGGMCREELWDTIIRKQGEIDQLRRQAARRGLPTDGSEADLRLRLAQNDSASITARDRQLHARLASLFALLGCAGLAVSLPHVTQEIATLTGLHMTFAMCIALIVDLGICGSKLLDCLGRKIDLGTTSRYNLLGLVLSLGMNGALNASGFYRHGGNLPLSLLFAAFLSLFLFGCFLLAGSLWTQGLKIPEKPTAAVDPVARLRQAADELERLRKLAHSL